LSIKTQTPECNTVDSLDSYISKMSRIQENAMKKALDLKCPIEIDIGLGDNWLEAH